MSKRIAGNKAPFPALGVVLFVVLIIVLELFYFREMLGNNSLFGDCGDGKFCNLTVEHWYRFIRGKDSFAELRMFYPEKGTIAYSDMLMLHAVPYCLFRVLGLGQFMAYKYAVILLHFIGTFAFAWFLKKNLRLSYPAVLAGVAVFAYSNPLVTSAHTQLYGYFLIPFVLIFAYNFICNMEERRKRRVYGLLTVLFVDGLFYNAFYIGYFFAVYVLVFCIFLLIVFRLRGEKVFKNILTYLKTNIKVIGSYILLAVVLLIPFLYMELPVITKFGERDWSAVVTLLPDVADVTNMHSGNLLNGWITSGEPRNLNSERAEGFPLILLLAILVQIVCLVQSAILKKRRGDSEAEGAEGAVYLAVAASFVVCIGMVLRQYGSYSGWYLFYRLIPGASAIRAVVRIFQLLCIPLAICLAKGCDQMAEAIRDGGGRHIWQRRIWKTAFAVIVMAQYIWSGSIYTQWNAADQRAFLNNVTRPPKECEVMYIRNSQLTPENSMECLNQAMYSTLIANRFGVECINGYSGQFPRELGEGAFQFASPVYEEKIKKWIQLHQLQNVYAYDVVLNQWERIDVQ